MPPILNVTTSFSLEYLFFLFFHDFTCEASTRREILFTDIILVVPGFGGGAPCPCLVGLKDAARWNSGKHRYLAGTCYRTCIWLIGIVV